MRINRNFRYIRQREQILLASFFVIVITGLLSSPVVNAKGAYFPDENVDITFYVKSDGDDNNTGTDSTLALATISEAMEKAIEQTEKGFKACVYVFNGTYEWKGWGISIPLGTTLLKLEGESKGGVIIDAAKQRGESAVIEATAHGDVYSRKNLIVRNIIIKNAPYRALEIGRYHMNRGLPDNNNILIKDCEFNNSGDRGLVLWHCDSTTVKGVNCKNNGTFGCKTFLRNSIVQDCEFSNNKVDGIWFGTHNTLFKNIVCNDNLEVGFRNDHIFTDSKVESLYVNGNKKGAVFEVVEGPNTIQNSVFENNRTGALIATVHGMTFYNCTFLNNTDVGLLVSNKIRDKAHTDCRAEAGWKCMASSGKGPVGELWHSMVPLSWNIETKIDSCRFSTNCENAWLIAKNTGVDHAADAHYVWVKNELKARNNRYYSSERTGVFDLTQKIYFRGSHTLTEWRSVVQQGPSTDGVWDETGSTWAPLGPLPSSPDSLKAISITSGQIHLSWNDVDDETAYKLQYKLLNRFETIAILDSNVTNYIHKGLTASKKYTYRVKALNQYGSLSSVEKTITTSDLPEGEPAAPSDLRGTRLSSGCINLEWIDNTNNESGFEIERQVGDDGSYALFAIFDADVTHFSDTWIQESKVYYYRVRAFNGNVYSDYSNEAKVSSQTHIEESDPEQSVMPATCKLYPNYPNPFNPTTYIRYDLAFDADVNCTIYNILGQKVKTLVDGRQTAGYKTAIWNSLDENNQHVVAGMYIIRISAIGKKENYTENRKILLIR